MDYRSMSGVTHVLNNAESVLQKDDVKDAIDGYEELFAGARKEVSLDGWYRQSLIRDLRYEHTGYHYDTGISDLS